MSTKKILKVVALAVVATGIVLGSSGCMPPQRAAADGPVAAQE